MITIKNDTGLTNIAPHRCSVFYIVRPDNGIDRGRKTYER